MSIFNMFEENFPLCNVCGKILTSDAGIQGRVTKYCKLCGMLVVGASRFCCEKCERTFKGFVKRNHK